MLLQTLFNICAIKRLSGDQEAQSSGHCLKTTVSKLGASCRAQVVRGQAPWPPSLLGTGHRWNSGPLPLRTPSPPVHLLGAFHKMPWASCFPQKLQQSVPRNPPHPHSAGKDGPALLTSARHRRHPLPGLGFLASLLPGPSYCSF